MSLSALRLDTVPMKHGLLYWKPDDFENGSFHYKIQFLAFPFYRRKYAINSLDKKPVA
jgi:hypothetical protein